MTTIDLTDPNPRPMIAILDAKPGAIDALRELVVELGLHVRKEPGCVAFTIYEGRDVEGRFYILEIYKNARAFRDHLDTAHVKHFIQRLPSVSPSSQEANLFQLDEIVFHANTVAPHAERALRT